MSRYIDEGKAIHIAIQAAVEVVGHGISQIDAVHIAEKFEEAPTADVAEVVRCKDCNHLMFSDCYGECRKARLGIVSPNDFCSRGERREK